MDSDPPQFIPVSSLIPALILFIPFLAKLYPLLSFITYIIGVWFPFRIKAIEKKKASRILNTAGACNISRASSLCLHAIAVSNSCW